MSYCFIVPHYNHAAELATFLPSLQALKLPIVLIDDGSDEQNLATLRKLCQHGEHLHLIEHGHNRGKGAAVRTGLVMARSLGFSHGLQIDADGQHNLDDVATFIQTSRENPTWIICGKPTFSDDAPKARVYGRRVTDFWTALETLSFKIKDGLCGFRVYPLQALDTVFDRYYVGPRMDFDTEVLVKAVWADIELHFINTQVIYPEGATSHFHYLRDNIVLIRLHTRLMFGMLLRLPWLVAKKITPASKSVSK